MRRPVVFAPDSFKGSLAAAPAAAAIAAGWVDVRPDDEAVLRPMADGGEGTLEAFAAAVPSSERVPVTVTGPDGARVDAAWLRLPDGTAVVELASTSGIELLGGRRLPWDAQTTGFGEAVASALDAGATRLVLGIGSSASTDAGIGLLRALGARFFDAAGVDVPSGARGLTRVAGIDLDGLAPLPERGVLVLSDVANPLLGSHGAAAVFGPQKGLDPASVAEADAALAAFADRFDVDPGFAGAGAAGGTGFALRAWGATLVPGSAEVAELIGLRAAVAEASVVITGEGSFDAQSAAGKAPAQVAAIAADTGTPAALVAGRIAQDADTGAFAASVSLSSLAGSSGAALGDPARWLRAAGAELARAF